jgi:hypothetical protein
MDHYEALRTEPGCRLNQTWALDTNEWQETTLEHWINQDLLPFSRVPKFNSSATDVPANNMGNIQ